MPCSQPDTQVASLTVARSPNSENTNDKIDQEVGRGGEIKYRITIIEFMNDCVTAEQNEMDREPGKLRHSLKLFNSSRQSLIGNYTK